MLFAHAADSSATHEIVFNGRKVNHFAVAFPTLRAERHLVTVLEEITMRPLHLHLGRLGSLFLRRLFQRPRPEYRGKLLQDFDIVGKRDWIKVK
jgi:hypothetical protein